MAAPVTFLIGNMPHYDFGLGKVVRIIRDTLSELGMESDEINLGYSQVPFYDGIKSQATDDIIKRMRDSAGVVFACTAQFFAPTAILQTFLEYLALDEYNDALMEKHCFLLTVSQNGGERSVLDYLSRLMQQLGAFDKARLGLQEMHTRGLDTDTALREIIEKETEDFYRALRQNRRFIIPRDYAARMSVMTGADVVVRMPEKEKKDRMPVSEVYKRLNLDAFTEQQEQDIQELTRLFAEKYTLPIIDETESAAPEANAPRARVVKPRVKTVKQVTQSLPHYFQPQLSGGLNAVIQISINGTENFEGYLTIANTECNYTDGVSPSPDITVMAETSVWQDVLKRKCTAQKAFMIGGLKVRGNFVLLTKFDSLFKLGEA